MRYYYDTEFLEDGKTIDLISIGIVAGDGREFYAVSNEFDTWRVSCDPWLMENVMSSIDHKPNTVAYAKSDKYKVGFTITDPAAMSRKEIAAGIRGFMAGTKPELWAWYGAYDHVALAQLWGKMINLPDDIPKYTHDIKTFWKFASEPVMPKQPEGTHNALADARHNRERFNFLVDLTRRR